MAEMVAGNNLSSGTYLLNFLLKLWVDMSDDEFKVLESTLSPIVNTSEEQVSFEALGACLLVFMLSLME